MKDGRSKGSGSRDRPVPDREALRRQVRHPYITRQEPRPGPEEESGPARDETPRPPAS